MEPTTVPAHSPTIHTWWNFSAPFPSMPPSPAAHWPPEVNAALSPARWFLWCCPHPNSDSPRAWQAGRQKKAAGGCVCRLVSIKHAPRFPGRTKHFAERNEAWVSPQQRGVTIVGRVGKQEPGRRQIEQQHRPLAGQTESPLASFFHAQVVEADKHPGTSRSDALLRPEARGGRSRPARAPSPLGQMLLQCFPGLLLTSQRFNCSQVQWPPAGAGLPGPGLKPKWPKHSTRMLT